MLNHLLLSWNLTFISEVPVGTFEDTEKIKMIDIIGPGCVSKQLKIRSSSRNSSLDDFAYPAVAIILISYLEEVHLRCCDVFSSSG